MKNAVFWGVAPCRCGRLNGRFGGSYRLHLQGRKIRVKTSNPTYLYMFTFISLRYKYGLDTESVVKKL
jgi:hypothetical protein